MSKYAYCLEIKPVKDTDFLYKGKISTRPEAVAEICRSLLHESLGPFPGKKNGRSPTDAVGHPRDAGQFSFQTSFSLHVHRYPTFLQI